MQPMRRSEYDQKDVADHGIIINIDLGADDADNVTDELCVRVHDNMDKDFIRNLMADASRHYRVGNLFISSVESFDSLREQVVAADRQRVVWMAAGMAFLLANVFLRIVRNLLVPNSAACRRDSHTQSQRSHEGRHLPSSDRRGTRHSFGRHASGHRH